MIDNFLSMHRVYQVQVASFIVILLAAAFLLSSPGSRMFPQVLMLLSLFGFAVGFTIWSWPYLTRVWAFPLGRACVAAIHVLVLLLSTACARFVVASSLRLPPQDFDLTVAFIALVFYVPAWSIVMSVMLACIAIIFELMAILSMFITKEFGGFMKWIAHMVGALAICFFSQWVFKFSVDNEAELRPLVKWIAFFVDFHPAPLYPGIQEGERIRLHENGVISVAAIKGGAIEIEVRRYEK